jgi:outer membrane lipoprotein carrier protein
MLGVVASTVALAGAQPAPPAEPATALAARVQERLAGIGDFTADVTQSYEGGVLRTRRTERGRVQVKKPGRMRWAYTSPEEKLFVSDGRKMYMWVPADKQVVVSPLPAAGEAGTPVLFLLGRGDLTRDFTAAYAALPAGAPAGAVALSLVPKHPEPEYTTLTLVVDRATLALRMLVAADAQGGTSTFTFTNLQENTGVPDSRFAFAIPRGADVVTR